MANDKQKVSSQSTKLKLEMASLPKKKKERERGKKDLYRLAIFDVFICLCVENGTIPRIRRAKPTHRIKATKRCDRDTGQALSIAHEKSLEQII